MCDICGFSYCVPPCPHYESSGGATGQVQTECAVCGKLLRERELVCFFEDEYLCITCAVSRAGALDAGEWGRL